MKNLYRIVLVLWLASGFALQAYWNRADRGTATAAPKPAVSRPSSEDQGAAQVPTIEAGWDPRAKASVAFAAWAVIGFAVAVRGVHELFRRADRVADIDRFLTA